MFRSVLVLLGTLSLAYAAYTTLTLTQEEKDRFVQIHNLFRSSFDLPLDLDIETVFDNRTCQDLHPDCCWMAQQGVCLDEPDWALVMCRKSCLMCRSNDSCEDTEPYWCPWWSARNECSINPNWMRPFCNASCSSCPRQAMPDLVWSDELAEEAANQTADCHFQHTWNSPYGENLFQAGRVHWNGMQAANAALFGWAQEREYVENNRHMCAYGWASGACGHYTQMIWYNTRSVGCAVHHCGDPGNEWKNTFVTCMYDPPGNWVVYNSDTRAFHFIQPVVFGCDMLNDEIPLE